MSKNIMRKVFPYKILSINKMRKERMFKFEIEWNYYSSHTHLLSDDFCQNFNKICKLTKLLA